MKYLNPLFCRYGFFIIIIVASIINMITVNESFYIFYIFTAVALGVGFYNRSLWFLTSMISLVVICRYFFMPDESANILTFFTYWITYFLIMFLSVGLMRNIEQIKKDNVELISALAKALDSRDKYTAYHSENVARYSLQIAKQMKLPKDTCEAIQKGGLLHDIGKLAIPENILTKPGKLETEEYEVIKQHPKIGYDIIKHVETFKEDGVLDIVLYHHERYDGKGYPYGLKGDQIPLVARITAVADAYDAMTSMRVYSDELDLEQVLGEIEKNKGEQFDPKITDVFLDLFDR